MKTFVKIKKAGSKRALTNIDYEIPFHKGTLQEILTFFVEQEVAKYNSREADPALIYLTEKDLDAAVSEGKVSFREAVTGRKADLTTAIENALLCYEDGLFRI